MENISKDNYLRVKKPVAIATLAGLGVLLAAIITFVVLDTIKIQGLENKLNTFSESAQMMGPGNMGGTPPEMNGEMPMMDGEAPELPADLQENTDSSSSTSGKNKNNRKSSSTTTETTETTE